LIVTKLALYCAIRERAALEILGKRVVMAYDDTA
jgi:hypothetical protein